MVRAARAHVPRSLGASLGVLVDATFGEPPVEPHPVAVFGSLMLAVEERAYAPTRAAGVTYAAIGVGVAAATGALLGQGTLATTAATALAVAGRGLALAAESVAQALEAGDLDEARRRLPALVGRDPDDLDEAGIIRAVVESVAENTTDAVVAPGLVGRVAGRTRRARLPGGQHARRHGGAPLGALRRVRLGQRPTRRRRQLAPRPPHRPAGRRRASPVGLRGGARVRRDAPGHPSPNSGVSEAAFAAALGLRLGGETATAHASRCARLWARAAPPAITDIARAVQLSQDVTLALAGVLAVAGSIWSWRRVTRQLTALRVSARSA